MQRPFGFRRPEAGGQDVEKDMHDRPDHSGRSHVHEKSEEKNGQGAEVQDELGHGVDFFSIEQGADGNDQGGQGQENRIELLDQEERAEGRRGHQIEPDEAPAPGFG